MNNHAEFVEWLRSFATSVGLKKLGEAADIIEQLVRERDAAIADIKKCCDPCDTCKHCEFECTREDGDCEKCTDNCICHNCRDNDRFEWRGLPNEN